MSNGSASPKDFVSLKLSLSMLPQLLDATEDLDNDMFASIREYRECISDYVQLVENTIVDNPLSC